MLGHTNKKILILIFSKFTCLFACKISTASLTSFWPCRREIANLLFYVIWACVATNTSNKSINLKKASTFISRQKINFILQILERSCELAVFGTLGLSGYPHPDWYYHLVESFWIYLQAKNQLHSPCFYGDIAKIWKLILGTLDIWLVTLTQNDSITLRKTLTFICLQKINFIIHLFLTILHFKESCNLIGWQHFDP